MAVADFGSRPPARPSGPVQVARELRGAENLGVRALGADAVVQEMAALIGRGDGGEKLLETRAPGFQDVGVRVLHQPGMFQFGGKAAGASGENLWQRGGK